MSNSFLHHQKDRRPQPVWSREDSTQSIPILDHYRHKWSRPSPSPTLSLALPMDWSFVCQSGRPHWVSLMKSGWCQASELHRTRSSSGWVCQEVASCWTASPVEVLPIHPCSVLHLQRIPQATKILVKSQSLFQNIRRKRSGRTTGCGGPWWLENRSSGLTWRSSSPIGESFLTEVVDWEVWSPFFFLIIKQN